MAQVESPRHRGLLAVATVALVALGLWSMRRDAAPDADQPVESVQSAQRDSLPLVEVGVTAGPAGGARIRGRVTAEDGRPLANAMICAHRLQLDMLDAVSGCARSGEDGRYDLAELAGGPYAVRASAEGHAGQRAEHDPLLLSGNETRDAVDFVLTRADANVRGVVRDALGGAVASATVRLVTAMPPAQTASVITDEEGQFALHFAEGPVIVTATAEGYAPDELGTVVPSVRMELTLTPAGRIAGFVRQPDGTPVADVEVRPDHGGVLNARSRLATRTDASGEFLLDGLPPGAYRLVAKGPHVQGVAEQTVHLGLAEQVRDLVITVQPASRVLGRVQRKDTDEACPHGSVMLSGMPDPMQPFPEEFLANGRRALPVPTQVASIGEEGTVELQGVPPGTYYAVVRCDGYRLVEGPRSVTLVAKAEDAGPFDWFVLPATTLTVRTVDERGQPVGRQVLNLRVPPPASGLGNGLLQMVSDADGLVRVPDLRAGAYAIGPAHPGLGANVEFEIADGALEAEVSVRLHGSGTLTVTVVDEHEQPVEDLQVAASAVGDTQGARDGDTVASRPRFAVSLGAGRYRIQPLPSGTYQVEAADGINPVSGGGERARALRVRSGEQVEWTMRLERGARLTGRVTDAEGAPAANVWVSARAHEKTEGWLSKAKSSRGRVLTDDRGEFVLEGLSRRGTYLVSAQDPYGSETSLDDAQPAQSIVLKLPATGRLEGQLRAGDGTPMRVHLARATSVDGRVERVGRVSADGLRFAIDSVPVGEFRVLATSTTGQAVSAQLHVKPGEEPTFVELALAEHVLPPVGAQPGPRQGLREDTPARAD